jgi:hypothetical protein
MLPDITTMTPLTEDELLADFDGILDRVEAGECFLIAGRLNVIFGRDEARLQTWFEPMRESLFSLSGLRDMHNHLRHVVTTAPYGFNLARD